MVYIETPHLLLRDWKEEDILPFVRMNSDKEVMEFFLTTLTEEETMAFYCRIRKEFEEYGYGLYAVECKETQNFLGYVGFHNIAFESDFTPGVEIGWRLCRDAWGKGYATEAASACLDVFPAAVLFLPAPAAPASGRKTILPPATSCRRLYGTYGRSRVCTNSLSVFPHYYLSE